MNRLVIGAPDKTNLLVKLMQESFANGFTLTDPDGALAEKVAGLVPVNQTQDSFYFDPSDMAHPAGFNILDDIPTDHRPDVAENVCAIIDGLLPAGPETLARAQSNWILTNCLRLQLDSATPNFLGIPRLLTDATYRAACLKTCGDPVVQAAWKIIESWEPRQFQAATAPLLTKIGTLLLSPSRRNILCQDHRTFSLQKGKIIIANLNRATIGDTTAKLLGSLALAYSSGHVFINDLPFFASDQLFSLLPQQRFTLVLQFLEQLATNQHRQAVLGIEDKYVFKTTHEDAEKLSHYVGISNPSILVDLSPNEVRTSTDTTQLPKIRVGKRLNIIRRRSRAAHTRPKALVEKRIAQLLQVR